MSPALTPASDSMVLYNLALYSFSMVSANVARSLVTKPPACQVVPPDKLQKK
mgnify:CR=1 FL=1